MKFNLLIFHGMFKFTHTPKNLKELQNKTVKISGNKLHIYLSKFRFCFKLIFHIEFCCLENNLSRLIKEAIESATGRRVKRVVPTLRNYHMSGRIKNNNFSQMKKDVVKKIVQQVPVDFVSVTTESSAPRERFSPSSAAGKQLLDPNTVTQMTSFFLEIENSLVIKFQQSEGDLSFTVVSSNINSKTEKILDLLEGFEKDEKL